MTDGESEWDVEVTSRSCQMPPTRLVVQLDDHNWSEVGFRETDGSRTLMYFPPMQLFPCNVGLHQSPPAIRLRIPDTLKLPAPGVSGRLGSIMTSSGSRFLVKYAGGHTKSRGLQIHTLEGPRSSICHPPWLNHGHLEHSILPAAKSMSSFLGMVCLCDIY